MNIRELKEIIKDLPDDMEVEAWFWDDKMWEYDRVIFKFDVKSGYFHISVSYN